MYVLAVRCSTEAYSIHKETTTILNTPPPPIHPIFGMCYTAAHIALNVCRRRRHYYARCPWSDDSKAAHMRLSVCLTHNRAFLRAARSHSEGSLCARLTY